MSALYVPGKRSLALMLVIGVMTGMAGVQAGHAGVEQMEKSDFDLPDLQEQSSDSRVLPEVVEDAYLRGVSGMLDGMLGYAMWTYSQGYALGELVQFLPGIVVTAVGKVVLFGSIVGLFAYEILRIKRLARGGR